MKNPSFNALFIGLIVTVFCYNSQAQTGTVQVDQNRAIEKLLEFKKDAKTVDAYKIQIYNGQRSGAESARGQANSLFGEWPVTMQYETPNYKIWIGNFRSRLEADRALLKVKKSYNDAFIFHAKKD